MTETIDQLLAHPLGVIAGYFSVAILALIIYLSCFEWVTKYNCWEEIRKGNIAAAMATGAKVFGLSNVLRSSIENSPNSIYGMIQLSFLGFVLLFAAYLLLEFLTPVFSIDEEIKQDNRAVGLIVLLITVSLSYVIVASIR